MGNLFDKAESVLTDVKVAGDQHRDITHLRFEIQTRNVLINSYQSIHHQFLEHFGSEIRVGIQYMPNGLKISTVLLNVQKQLVYVTVVRICDVFNDPVLPLVPETDSCVLKVMGTAFVQVDQEEHTWNESIVLALGTVLAVKSFETQAS